MSIQPVILSGGSGTRLWPASTDERPKQFHALASLQTMLQQTAGRTKGEGFLDPLVICNHRHGAEVSQQLNSAGLTAGDIILEPFGRNTAAAAIIAAAWAERASPGALVLLMPADHVIADEAGFRTAVQHAAKAAEERIVTFGMTPTGPETGYGYIKSGALLYDEVHKVERFIEKPERSIAEAYLQEGGYSWNAGIFLYAPRVLLGEAERLCPEILNLSLKALSAASEIDTGKLLDPDAFRTCPSSPIDVAILEKTDKAAVMPCSIGWADIGSWSELWRHGEKDENENHVRGDAVLIDVSESLIWAEGPTVSVIGLSKIIVVATKDHVLVAASDRAQEVKAVVERRKNRP